MLSKGGEENDLLQGGMEATYQKHCLMTGFISETSGLLFSRTICSVASQCYLAFYNTKKRKIATKK